MFITIYLCTWEDNIDRFKWDRRYGSYLYCTNDDDDDDDLQQLKCKKNLPAVSASSQTPLGELAVLPDSLFLWIGAGCPFPIWGWYDRSLPSYETLAAKLLRGLATSALIFWPWKLGIHKMSHVQPLHQIWESYDCAYSSNEEFNMTAFVIRVILYDLRHQK